MIILIKTSIVREVYFKNLGYDGTLLLLNNPDTQEQTLTAMGIDPGLVNNLTPDSFDKIRKITNLKPGGTPATGWDGKFYRYDDPRLEASRVIPLEIYLQAREQIITLVLKNPIGQNQVKICYGEEI